MRRGAVSGDAGGGTLRYYRRVVERVEGRNETGEGVEGQGSAWDGRVGRGGEMTV